MVRRYTSITLKECPHQMIRLVCSRCERKGQYRKQTLLAEYGPDVTMPDLLHLIAKCPRHGDLSKPCGARYGDLMSRGG
jgi:hypothetical protein